MIEVSVIKRFKNVTKKVTIDQVVHAIKSGKTNNVDLKKNIEAIRQLKTDGKKENADRIKMGLPAVTFQATFNNPRNTKNLDEYNQCIILDFDHIENIDRVKQTISECQNTHLVFTSPSGDGLKVLVKVDSELEHHLQAFHQVVSFYEKLTGAEIDQSGKDVARLTFLSYDPEIYYNPDSEVFSVDTSIKLEPNLVKGKVEIENPIGLGQDADFEAIVEFTEQHTPYEEGNRNDHLHLLANNCNRQGMELSEALELIKAKYSDHENQSEIETSVRSAYKNVEDFGNRSSDMEASSTFGISAKELWDMEVEEIPMLIEGIIPKVGLAILGGSSDTSKSTFLRQLGTEIALGRATFLGYKIDATHNNVVYVSTEDDQNSIAYLIRKQALANTEELKGLNGLTYVFDSEKLLSKLDKYLKDNPTDLVIIDAFGDVFAGESNLVSSVRPYLNKYSDLAKRYDCAIVFLHHTGKRAVQKPPNKNNLLGSQGIEAKMRLVIELRKDLFDTSLRHMCIVKGNYIPEEMKQSSVVLKVDENMVFSNTGDSVPFNELVKSDTDNTNWKSKAVELKQSDCLSVTEVYKKLQQEGCNFSRGTIGNWVKGVKCDSNESQEPEDEIQDAEIVE